MSIRSSQLVKWTFPVALIIGLFWYKRRRVDRVDPGGKVRSHSETQETVTVKQKTNNLYDSAITIDDSLANSPSSSNDTMSNSPRKVSESLDIPTKELSAQPISGIPWYAEVDDMPGLNNIALGSNPKSSSLEMMSKAMGEMEIGNENVTKSQEIIKEEPEEQTGACIAEASNADADESKVSRPAISDRDSANHSPVSGVLDGSVNDEIRSEGSTDSGKGGSINGKASNNKSITTYEFEIPHDLVGRLIGKRGSTIQNLNAKAQVKTVVDDHPTSKLLKLCIIEGLEENIKTALELIRQRFPIKKFPEMTLEEVHLANNPEEIPWVAEIMQLHLIDGVNNDVMVCHILEPNRLFIQLPTHPTYPSLRLLDYNMTQLYNTVDSPPVPDKLSQGMLVVAKWYDKWVRAYIEQPDPEGHTNLVRLVDHGGFWNFSNSEMRKIRSDYLTLPFQAIEVNLSNVKPKNGEWQPEAYDIVAQICSNSIGQAQIEGYIDSSIFISLYFSLPKHGVISLAHELIARGFAESVSLEDILPQVPALHQV